MWITAGVSPQIRRTRWSGPLAFRRVELMDNLWITMTLLEAGCGLVTGSSCGRRGCRVAGSLGRSPQATCTDCCRTCWLPRRNSTRPAGSERSLLQGGPDAALTHVTALWNWGLMEDVQAPLHVAVPRSGHRSTDQVQVHVNRSCESVLRNGLPTVPVGRAVAAAAVDVPLEELRFPEGWKQCAPA